MKSSNLFEFLWIPFDWRKWFWGSPTKFALAQDFVPQKAFAYPTETISFTTIDQNVYYPAFSKFNEANVVNKGLHGKKQKKF